MAAVDGHGVGAQRLLRARSPVRQARVAQRLRLVHAPPQRRQDPLDRVAQLLLACEAHVGRRQPTAALDLHRRRARDHDLVHRSIAEQRLQRPEPERALGDPRGELSPPRLRQDARLAVHERADAAGQVGLLPRLAGARQQLLAKVGGEGVQGVHATSRRVRRKLAPIRRSEVLVGPAPPARHARTMTRAAALIALLAIAIVVAVAACGGTDPKAASVTQPTGFEDVIAKALPSVVQIRSQSGLGSGIVLDVDGHVVTNAHVVAGFSRFKVTLSDGSVHNASLKGSYPQGDLAVVQLDGARPKPAVFADSSKARVGEYALAIGNPLGLRSSVTQGIVSSTSRTVPEGGGVTLPSVIQTSAPINPGNSGGALVDSTGAVIGIPTLAAEDPEMGGAADGIGFAISSNTVRAIASQLIAHGRVLHSGRAWLDVELRTVDGLGVVVASAPAKGPAGRAGIRAGDVIVSVAGRPTPSVDELADALATEPPGRRVTV